MSYELSHVYKSSLDMFDVEGFRAGRSALRERVLEQHKKGALVSFVWHMKCPKAAPNDRDLFAPNECPSHYSLAELLSELAENEHAEAETASTANVAIAQFPRTRMRIASRSRCAARAHLGVLLLRPPP